MRLEPPYTRDAADPDQYRGVLPLERGPIVARTRSASRWHRVRSGITYTTEHRLQRLAGEDRTILQFWCGSGYATLGHEGVDDPPMFDRRAMTADTVPTDEPLCGPCEGRAIGAGYPPVAVLATDTRLRFDPFSHYRIPPVCPACGPRSQLVPDGPVARTFPCPACAEPARLRASGRGYHFDVIIESHQPGDGLVAPCPFHRWDQLILTPDNRARCRCAPLETP